MCLYCTFRGCIDKVCGNYCTDVVKRMIITIINIVCLALQIVCIGLFPVIYNIDALDWHEMFKVNTHINVRNCHSVAGA